MLLFVSVIIVRGGHVAAFSAPYGHMAWSHKRKAAEMEEQHTIEMIDEKITHANKRDNQVSQLNDNESNYLVNTEELIRTVCTTISQGQE